MPKERRDRSVSFDRSCPSPFRSCSSRPKQSNTKNAPESDENPREWEEARCPVCMEHPHNAVLLTCSSHDKGCRPYMCDTSHRHSNCLDQFKKSFSKAPQEENTTEDHPEAATVSDVVQVEGSSSSNPIVLLDPEEKLKLKLMCPLCRGKVTGWTIVASARTFMNAKSRSCALEDCDFCGTYPDLRKHAREEHPSVRPSVADPERERNWRRLERQREFGDMISTLESLGEGRDSSAVSGGGDSILSFDEGGWLTVFFLIRVFRPGNSSSGPRSSSSSWSGSSRARAQVTVRRRSARLWGETHEGGGVTEPVTRDQGDDNEVSDGGSVSRRTRRRLMRQVSSDEEN